MGVRPPGSDAGDEPDVPEFGIVALDAKLDERSVSFPTTAADLAADHGDLQVEVDPAGHELSLAEALERCGPTEFDSQTELLDVLHPVFEAEREARSGGVLGQLRALLPF
jgi:hypothetical protein